SGTEPPAQKVVGPLAVIVGVGSGFTVTVVAAEVAVQPFASVTLTLYEPELDTLIDCVVAPFDQRYDAAADAVSVTEPPAQNVVGPLAVTTGVGGFAFTVTAVPPDDRPQPSGLITMTPYSPEAVTTIDCV